MKCFPLFSARVRDWSRVRMANTTRMSSKRVLPGSFWCELFTYRWMTAEPGSLSKIV